MRYIFEKDYNYLLSLYKGLDHTSQQRFTSQFLQAIGAASHKDMRRSIKILSEHSQDHFGVLTENRITRTLIKKVFNQTTKQLGAR